MSDTLSLPADLISVARAARILRLGPRQVQRYCERGELRAVRVGRTYLVSERSARQFTPPPPGRPGKPDGQTT